MVGMYSTAPSPVATAERAIGGAGTVQEEAVCRGSAARAGYPADSGCSVRAGGLLEYAEQFDHVLPEDDPRRHYDLPRNTLFDRVHDTTKEDTTEEQTKRHR